jgi:hypothetical protein
VTRPTGSANLPLHGGRVPAWLATRMTQLGVVICEAIVLEYGSHEFLRRLAHPFWFQSFGAVMGMDWHSSGITTSVMGALKRGLADRSHELGLYVCGGRGRHSRKTPDELCGVGERTGLDGEQLARTSRLVAKVDSAAVQDGFELYLHSFVVANDGAWTVVQQGMNPKSRQARRYHWLSESVASFVDAPHAAIEGPPQGEILNLTDARAEASRAGQLELIQGGPGRIVDTLCRLREQAPTPQLSLPSHHDVRASDVVMRRLHATLAVAYDCGPADFPELLLTRGLGGRTLLALATVAEVLHGAPCRFSDPGRFSTALGGKDGHPFPVPLQIYDETLRVLRDAVSRARLGNEDRMAAIHRLDQQARALEQAVPGSREGMSFDEFVQGERSRSPAIGGMTVSGPASRPALSRDRSIRPDKPAAASANGRPDRLPRRRDRGAQLTLPGLGA